MMTWPEAITEAVKYLVPIVTSYLLKVRRDMNANFRKIRMLEKRVERLEQAEREAK